MNTLFKKFCAFSVIATLAMGFVSCGNDDEPEPQPEVKSYNLLYAVAVPNDNLLFGKTSVTALDASGKEMTLNLPDNGVSAWDNTSYEKPNAQIEKLINMGAEGDKINISARRDYNLRYISAPDMKVGTKYYISAKFTPEKSMIEALDDEKDYTVGSLRVFCVRIDSKGDALLFVDTEGSMSLMSGVTKSKTIENFDTFVDYFKDAVTKTGTMKD